MKSIPEPIDDAGDVFKVCISEVRDERLKRRLNATIPEIVESSNRLKHHALKSKLHKIKTIKYFKSGATAKEVSNVYTSRMVPKRSPGRPFYQKILNSATLDICPLCGQRTVSTLDHYLDKSVFPQFSVTPYNLVPSCKDCNFGKSTFPVPTNPNDFTIHPYFDDIDQHKWLTCTIPSHRVKVQTLFSVTPHKSWTPVLTNRVQRHFLVFDLAKLYSIHAAVELNTKKQKLIDLLTHGGSNAVRDHLEIDAKSHKAAAKNSWSTALYSALASSEWFHHHGVPRL